MPVLHQNNTAICIQTTINTDDDNVLEKLNGYLQKVNDLLENTFNTISPQLLVMDENGKVDESIYYQEALPVKENEIISTIHLIIRNELEKFIKTEEEYEGPFTNMVFDECIEGDNPYHGPIYMSSDLYYIGIIFESEFEMDEVESLCKEAMQYDDSNLIEMIEVVDWSGKYLFFKHS